MVCYEAILEWWKYRILFFSTISKIFQALNIILPKPVLFFIHFFFSFNPLILLRVFILFPFFLFKPENSHQISIWIHIFQLVVKCILIIWHLITKHVLMLCFKNWNSISLNKQMKISCLYYCPLGVEKTESCKISFWGILDAHHTCSLHTFSLTSHLLSPA